VVHADRLDRLIRGEKRALVGLTAAELGEVAVYGHHHYETGRLAGAQRIFEGLVVAGPDEAFPHIVLGAIYLSQEKVSLALAQFEAALRLEPASVAALVYRGEIRLRRSQDAKAIADLEKALALASDPKDPLVARAKSALLRLGRAAP
jgi:tetratricopeptide (TPR) repeat protein